MLFPGAIKKKEYVLTALKVLLHRVDLGPQNYEGAPHKNIKFLPSFFCDGRLFVFKNQVLHVIDKKWDKKLACFCQSHITESAKAGSVM